MLVASGWCWLRGSLCGALNAELIGGGMCGGPDGGTGSLGVAAAAHSRDTCRRRPRPLLTAASEPACLLAPRPPSVCSCSVHHHRVFHGAHGTAPRVLQPLERVRALT